MKTMTATLLALLLAMPAAQAQDIDTYSQAELDQMLAPVALYPDPVLSHILIAATYPLEIVQAARWVRDNPGLEGEQAVAAVEDRDWDPSVKALVAFPALVKRMDEDLEWSRGLGDAFLVQEAQVVATIQDLRRRADEAGHLASSDYARVERTQETIAIEPVRTRVVYVPYYDPWVVYGPWWHPAYPPVYWPHPFGFHGSVGLIFWSHGHHVSPGFFHARFFWPHRHIVIVKAHHRGKPKRWRHEPRHRRGVSYRRGVPRQVANDAAVFTTDRSVRDPGVTAQRPSQQRPQRTQRAQRDWASERRENLRISRGDSADRQSAPTVQRRPAPTARQSTQRSTATPRFTAPQRAATPSRAAPARRATPTRSVTPQRSATPSRSVTPSRHAAPARSVTPSRSATPQRRATPTRSVAPSRSATPPRSASPSRSVTPSRRASPPQRAAPVQRAAPPKRSAPAPSRDAGGKAKVRERRRIDG